MRGFRWDVALSWHSDHVDDVTARLERQRRETVERLASLTGSFEEIVAASRDSNADDEHDPEGSTIAFERSQVAALVSQGRDQLTEIDAALARVAAGTYGICERCGEPISDERLAARPVARTCIRCA